MVHHKKAMENAGSVGEPGHRHGTYVSVVDGGSGNLVIQSNAGLRCQSVGYAEGVCLIIFGWSKIWRFLTNLAILFWNI